MKVSLLTVLKSKSSNMGWFSSIVNTKFYNYVYVSERNLALQGPILHPPASFASSSSSSAANSIIQGQYVNSQNRNEPINSPPNSNHTTTTTLTPLVNAKIHPHPQLSQHDPSQQYATIATIQQQNQLQTIPQPTHVQYQQGIQAVLHQVCKNYIQLLHFQIQIKFK